jgi:hypothetical protein
MFGRLAVAVIGGASSRTRLALEALGCAAGARWYLYFNQPRRLERLQTDAYSLVTLGLRLSTNSASNCSTLRHPGVWVVRFRKLYTLRRRGRGSRC